MMCARRVFAMAAAVALMAVVTVRAEQGMKNVTATSSCILGTASGCSTSVAKGLTAELITELNSMGYSFDTLDSSYVKCSSPCEPYLQSVAANGLYDACKEASDYITLNSAYRSSAQQYLLYNWYLQGKCGITAAAKPGTSNHEGGLAIDTSYYTYWDRYLTGNGWKWYGSGDVVHFDYVASGTSISRESLRAFQKLWNENNPNDQIDEDGLYGPDTANALYQSPCEGW